MPRAVAAVNVWLKRRLGTIRKPELMNDRNSKLHYAPIAGVVLCES